MAEDPEFSEGDVDQDDASGEEVDAKAVERRRRSDLVGPGTDSYLRASTAGLAQLVRRIIRTPESPRDELYRGTGLDLGDTHYFSIYVLLRRLLRRPFRLEVEEKTDWAIGHPVEFIEAYEIIDKALRGLSIPSIESSRFQDDAALFECDDEFVGEALSAGISEIELERARLEEREQDLVQAARMRGLTWAAVGQALEISESQAHRRYHPGSGDRARAATREWMRKRAEGDSV